jgi:hypothetical protein
MDLKETGSEDMDWIHWWLLGCINIGEFIGQVRDYQHLNSSRMRNEHGVRDDQYQLQETSGFPTHPPTGVSAARLSVTFAVTMVTAERTSPQQASCTRK